jgi:DNA-binding PadR family transcriptional regulator
MNYTEPEYWAGLLNAGLCRLLILRMVCEEPAHGYAIRRRVADRTGRVCRPTEGAVYPILHELERAGCLRSHTESRGNRNRVVYEATARGRQAAKAGAAVWRRALPPISRAFEMGAIERGLHD